MSIPTGILLDCERALSKIDDAKNQIGLRCQYSNEVGALLDLTEALERVTRALIAIEKRHQALMEER